jgi:membrane associated rhomboid family serine protease
VIPLHDNVRTARFPAVTVALIAINVAVFLFQITRPDTTLPGYVTGLPHAVAGSDALSAEWGFTPCELGNRCVAPDRAVLPEPGGQAYVVVRVPHRSAWLTLFTSMFLHGGWLHIGGNMLFLWIFGNNVEDRMGRVRFVVFYLLCGAIAGLSQLAVNPSSDVPNIGASGAIAGVLGGYILLYPRARVVTLIFLIVFFTVVEVPAWAILTFWFLLQLLDGSAVLASQGSADVAYFAHVGGFVAGLLLIRLFVAGRSPPPPRPALTDPR